MTSENEGTTTMANGGRGSRLPTAQKALIICITFIGSWALLALITSHFVPLHSMTFVFIFAGIALFSLQVVLGVANMIIQSIERKPNN